MKPAKHDLLPVPARQIIRKLGGSTKLARRFNTLGYPLKAKTCDQWGVRGSFPAWAIPVLLDIAATDGLNLTHRDFLGGGEHPYEFLL